ncbi:hypothetical protein FGO68_gene452 [Halteria grandinella]|uniref:CMP/dCMP-type deaminase domain-containing protein n=1 Tax=Halteria grandinella TaxID=5974 RepID=A0A8J8T273_HALGN|nr:hypothetical protein FGO68_gene452 [Halteria grandinella]
MQYETRITNNKFLANKHAEILDRAVDIATKNVTSGGGPFGAIIVDREGNNIAESADSVERTLDPTAHAEICAIREACKKLNSSQLDGCILYASCEPCSMCLSAAYLSRLERIYYAADRSIAVKAGLSYDDIGAPISKSQIQMERLQVIEKDRPFDMWRLQQLKTEL